MKVEPALNILLDSNYPVKSRVRRLSPDEKTDGLSVEKDFYVSISGRVSPGNSAISQTIFSVYKKPETGNISLPQKGYGFRVDVNNESVMVVTDKKSGKVVKQIPTEEQQRINASLNKFKEALEVKESRLRALYMFSFSG